MKKIIQLRSSHMVRKKCSLCTNKRHSPRVMPRYRRLTPSVVDECGLVAPNQRRTETGAGTQSPPGLAVLVPPREGRSSLVWGGQFVSHSLRVGRDSRVHIWNGWWRRLAQDQTVHMNRLSCALGGVLNHHHQWRLERFDAPRSGPQALQLAESLPNRWPRSI